MEDLKGTCDQILAYLKSQNLKVFSGNPIIVEHTTIMWDKDNDDWKSFIEIAKDEGARSMILHKEEGRGEQANKIGSMTLAWIKDGIVYLFNKRADWWKQEIAEGGELPEIAPSIRIGYGGEVPRKLRKELEEKSEEQLAEELVAFTDKEFPKGQGQMQSSEMSRLFWQKKGLTYGYVDDPELSIKIRKVEMLFQQKLSSEILEKPDEELVNEALEFAKKQFGETPPTYRVTDLFWESKGLRRYMADPNVRVKMAKVESMVRQKLEEGQVKHEKEVLPTLVDECLEWARKNGLRKVTKSNCDYFLTEKSVQLSKTSRDAIYNQVNFRLGKV